MSMQNTTNLFDYSSLTSFQVILSVYL